MESKEKTRITIQALIEASVQNVWKNWITLEDIVKWNNASDDWHTTKAKNDFRVGGRFNFRMEAKDGSFGFDFWGIYDEIILNKQIDYTLGDGRKVKILFSELGNKTEVVQTFEAENTHPVELQRQGWQSILDNFKKHTEGKSN